MSDERSEMLGSSPLLTRTLHAARMVAATDAPVLIIGEPGAGKTLLAEKIHEASLLRSLPLTRINCAGLSQAQLEQQLCSPDQETRPLTGTLYLQQVGELPLDAQVRLLQLMTPGANDQGQLRWLASTSQDLHQAVTAGSFREDLFYRLNVVPLELAPLRDRREDIVQLLKQFTRQFAALHRRRAPRYSVASRNLLKQYAWPGNVRELRNLCERMVILLAGTTIQPDNLPLEIRQAIGMSGGNRSRAARLLGISRDTLLYRLQKHEIQ